MNEYDLVGIIRDNSTIGDTVLAVFAYIRNSIIVDKYGDINNAIHNFLFSVLGLVMVIRAILGMSGRITVHMREIGISAIWLLIALSVSAPSVYVEWLVIPITSIGGAFTSLLTNNYGSAFEGINILLSNTLSIIDQMQSELGVTDLLYKLILFVCGGLYVLLYGMYIIVVVYSQFSLTILFLFGGLIMQISAFKTCRGMLKSWGQAVAKYTLVSVVAALIMGITYGFASLVLAEYLDFLGSDAANFDASTGFNYLFWLFVAVGFVGVILMMKAIEITTEMTGGIATDMSQSFNAAANGVNAASTPLKLAASGLKKKITG